MPIRRREDSLAEHLRDEIPEESQEFLRSLADVVERVNAVARRQHDARAAGEPPAPERDFADTEPAVLDPVDEQAAAAVVPYGIHLALDLEAEARPVTPRRPRSRVRPTTRRPPGARRGGAPR